MYYVTDFREFGSSVGDKACLTWSIAAEYLKRLPPDAAPTSAGKEECAQIQTLFMDDEGRHTFSKVLSAVTLRMSCTS
jgi:hypothetical protein